MGEDGLSHNIETYHIEEVETADERRKRNLADMAGLKAHFEEASDELIPQLRKPN